MYTTFYRLSESPFAMTPDPRYFFASRKHLDALSSLLYAIEYKKGFAVLTGEVGAGKTTVCRVMLKELPPTTTTAIITNSNLTEQELICSVLHEYGVRTTMQPKALLLRRLNEFLIDQLSQGRNPVLIIDEAQNLSVAVIEEIRMLANLETEREKLLQVVLMGQPQLRDLINRPELEQFKQRVAVSYHLMPLDLEETRAYIEHRLNTAGQGTASPFLPDAIERLHGYCKGVPRLINVVCDAALVTGYALSARQITASIIDEIIADLDKSLGVDWSLDDADSVPRVERSPGRAQEPATTRVAPPLIAPSAEPACATAPGETVSPMANAEPATTPAAPPPIAPSAEPPCATAPAQTARSAANAEPATAPAAPPPIAPPAEPASVAAPSEAVGSVANAEPATTEALCSFDDQEGTGTESAPGASSLKGLRHFDSVAGPVLADESDAIPLSEAYEMPRWRGALAGGRGDGKGAQVQTPGRRLRARSGRRRAARRERAQQSRSALTESMGPSAMLARVPDESNEPRTESDPQQAFFAAEVSGKKRVG